jgi:hypothetical protein
VKKQDTWQQGLFTRIRLLVAATAAWDVVWQRLKQHAELHGLSVSQLCTDLDNPGASLGMTSSLISSSSL